jgi:hypothetical protein
LLAAGASPHHPSPVRACVCGVCLSRHSLAVTALDTVPMYSHGVDTVPMCWPQHGHTPNPSVILQVLQLALSAQNWSACAHDCQALGLHKAPPPSTLPISTFSYCLRLAQIARGRGGWQYQPPLTIAAAQGDLPMLLELLGRGAPVDEVRAPAGLGGRGELPTWGHSLGSPRTSARSRAPSTCAHHAGSSPPPPPHPHPAHVPTPPQLLTC